MSKWDELTMAEKAEMIGVAVRNGITNLQDIREKYNEFAEGGDTQRPYVYYKDKKGNLVDYSYGDYDSSVDAANRWRELKENGHPYYLEPQNVLPEVTVTGYRPIELKTYYPLSREYPLTGHSELYIPITNDVADDYNLRTHEDVADNKSIALDIDKLSTAKDYNLLLNNCADSTLGYLNKMFGTSESPTLFTTPGDVRDFAVDTLHGKVINKNGVETVIIPRNKKNADILSKRAVELWNLNSDNGNGYIDYQHAVGGPLVEAANEYKHGGSIHIKPENRGKFIALKKRTGHSATWFKQHGTPAQKKMATFAINAAKWKHGLGGNLFAPGGDTKASDYRYVLDGLYNLDIQKEKQ